VENSRWLFRLLAAVLSVLLPLAFAIAVWAQKRPQRTHIYWCVEPRTGMAFPCKYAPRPERYVWRE
jgi:hypothetical protein